MKKMISMVMAAAMVATLVPANAFAAVNKPDGDVPATVKVLGAKDGVQDDKEFKGVVPAGPEVQIKIGKASYSSSDVATDNQVKYKFTVKLDNADFDEEYAPKLIINEVGDESVESTKWDGDNKVTADLTHYNVVMEKTADDEMDVIITGNTNTDLLEEDEYITIKLGADTAKGETGATIMDKYSDGKSASVAVTSRDLKLSNDNTDLTYITVGSKDLKVSVKKTVDIAQDDIKTIERVTIEPAVGDTFANMFKDGDKIRVRVTNGFEFKNYKDAELETVAATKDSDENELVFEWNSSWDNLEELKLDKVTLDSKSAKDGAVASLKVYAPGCDTVSIEVAKVIGSDVTLSVDKDEDVPVIYSGVDVKNTGLTDDSDHMSLEVTLKEAAAGVWNTSKDFTLTLPEGVYVVDDKKGTDVEGIQVKTHDNVTVNTDKTDAKDIEKWMADAYKEGDYLKFDFDKRSLKQTDPSDKTNNDPIELSFKLQLVADPNFVGDVKLKLEGAAVETQEVTIAKFVKPYTVEAKQNDLSIDYRNTKVPTDVVIKEAEAGLWDKGTDIILSLDKIDFDEKGTVTVDEKSGLKVKDNKLKKVTVGDDRKGVEFTVDTMSGDEPAVVTISGMELYMDRSLPAGAYDLEVTSDKMHKNAYNKQYVASTDADDKDTEKTILTEINEDYVDFVEKAGFITITTAGREDADSFTTKVTVPIGGTTITAGGSTIDVDTPAYINAAGYTMLPLRAVAVALGIPSTSVMWNGEARSITIMYGSKVISMTIGQKTMYVNGSPVAMSAAPEITNSRTFLPFRDLGVALGVSDITFEKDPATSKVTTVYFNAGK